MPRAHADNGPIDFVQCLDSSILIKGCVQWCRLRYSSSFSCISLLPTHKLGRPERSKGCSIPICCDLCGTSKSTFQTSLTGDTMASLPLLVLRDHLRYTLVCQWVYHPDCTVRKRRWYIYMKDRRQCFDFYPPFSSSLFSHFHRASTNAVITISEGLAHPLTCQPFLKLKPLKWLLT